MSKSKRVTFQQLVCTEYGDPPQVIHLREEETIPEPNKDEVLVQMLMAPINPVDINIIQGVYGPLNLPIPNVPGYEGVGKIVKVGSNVENLIVGDHVIPVRFIGVWRTYFVAQPDTLLKVSNEVGLPEAATLAVNPPTMYRMLKDFVTLNPGDTMIQNGANSACGVIAIQMCRIWGIVSVNVVRDRPDIDDLKTYLKGMGANYVFTEEEIGNTDIFKNGKAQRPLLALNCVGGKSASLIMKHLNIGGVMVTYGGMSMQPISVSTSALVFRDLSLNGFNIGRWMMNDDNSEEKVKMFDEITKWYLQKKLKMPPYVLIKLEEFKGGLENTVNKKVMIGKKYILDFSGIYSKM